MITDIESPEKKDICFFQNFELKIDENYNSNVTLPINGEKILKETNHLNNNDITNNYSNILLSDNFYQLEFDDISNEELYLLISKYHQIKKMKQYQAQTLNQKIIIRNYFYQKSAIILIKLNVKKNIVNLKKIM